MPRPTRPALIASASAFVALLAAASPALASEAAPAPTPTLVPAATTGPTSPAVLFAGRITDKHGTPIPGPMSVTAMPNDMQKWKQTFTVGEATADAQGNYAVTVTDPSTIEELAAEQEGVVDFVVSSRVAGAEGGGFISRRVVRRGNQLGLVDSNVDPKLARRAGGPPTPPTVDFTVRDERAKRARQATAGDPTATRSQMPVICTAWQADPSKTKSIAKWTVVGELNNAYNDGTVATFSYGRERHAETAIGVASNFGDGGWSISETKSMTDSGTVGFAPAARRWARKMQTTFEYTKTEETQACGVAILHRTYIRPTDWRGGTRDAVKQAAALDRCDRDAPTYGPGSSASTGKQSAVRFDRAVDAFGVSLTAQSGFSTNVSIAYEFKGSKGKQHRVCGEDGKQGIWASGRAYSGAKK